MKASVVTFAQLPEEEAAFLAYLAKTGDIWARAARDAPSRPAHPPAPVAEFMEAHADELRNGATVDVYLGFRQDVLRPVATTIEGRKWVDMFASCLLGYTRGEYYSGGELAQSNLFFYRSFFRQSSFQGEKLVKKRPAFLHWAANVLRWARRHTPKRVPVHRCNYTTRATKRVSEAVATGLKVWY